MIGWKKVAMKPALLIIDVQKGCYRHNPDAVESLDRAVRYINAAISVFRSKELPVVSIQHIAETMGMEPGKEDFELPETLDVVPEDLHIHKRCGNAFSDTGLADDLKALGADTLIMTGYCAEYCVLSTYRGAQDRGFRPIMLRGALASDDRENIGFVEKISELVTLGALERLLG